MRLAPEADVRAQLGLGTAATYVAAVNAALDAATMALEQDLQTGFDLDTYTDWFAPTPGNPFTLLKLKHGFVVPGSVVVTYAPTYALVSTAGVDLSAECMIDNDKGSVRVMSTVQGSGGHLFTGTGGFYGLGGHFVRVTYQAGFDTTAADPLLYDPAQVPMWLSDLAKIKARIGMGGHPALDATKATFDVHNDRLPETYAAALAGKTRYMPDSIPAM